MSPGAIRQRPLLEASSWKKKAGLTGRVGASTRHAHSLRGPPTPQRRALSVTAAMGCTALSAESATDGGSTPAAMRPGTAQGHAAQLVATQLPGEPRLWLGARVWAAPLEVLQLQELVRDLGVDEVQEDVVLVRQV